MYIVMINAVGFPVVDVDADDYSISQAGVTFTKDGQFAGLFASNAVVYILKMIYKAPNG